MNTIEIKADDHNSLTAILQILADSGYRINYRYDGAESKTILEATRTKTQ